MSRVIGLLGAGHLHVETVGWQNIQTFLFNYIIIAIMTIIIIIIVVVIIIKTTVTLCSFSFRNEAAFYFIINLLL